MPSQLSHFKLTFGATLLPSIGNMIFIAVFFVLIFGSGNALLGDGDTGYHIKTGQVILKNWSIPAHDFYSFHFPALSWTAHEWLADRLMGNDDDVDPRKAPAPQETEARGAELEAHG